MKAFLKHVLKPFPRVLTLARRIMMESLFRYRYHRRLDSLAPVAGYTKGTSVEDGKLIDRLMASYRLRAEAPTGMWGNFFSDLHSDIHEAILSKNRTGIEAILRNPVSSDLMYGFDGTVRSLRQGGMRIEDRHAPALTLDALLCLAESLGVRRIDNPESYTWQTRRTHVDEVVVQIEKALQFPIAIPNPFPAEYGLVSLGGIISYRVPQAIYQAWRIAHLMK